MIDLDAVVLASERLEPLPSNIAHLAALLVEEDSGMAEIARVISLDPILTVRVLRAANSSFWGGGRMEAKRVIDAVNRLGRSNLLPLALGQHVKRYTSTALPQYGLSSGSMWKRSVAAALAAESMQPFVKVKVPPETAAAALLHDIGQVVLARFLDPEILSLLKRAQSEGNRQSVEAERELLGVHHGEVGGLIAHHWALPEGIVKGISYHHKPQEEPRSISYTTALASIVACLVDRQPVSALEIKSILKVLGVDRQQLMTLCKIVFKKRKEVLELYG